MSSVTNPQIQMQLRISSNILHKYDSDLHRGFDFHLAKKKETV